MHRHVRVMQAMQLIRLHLHIYLPHLLLLLNKQPKLIVVRQHNLLLLSHLRHQYLRLFDILAGVSMDLFGTTERQTEVHGTEWFLGDEVFDLLLAFVEEDGVEVGQ